MYLIISPKSMLRGNCHVELQIKSCLQKGIWNSTITSWHDVISWLALHGHVIFPKCIFDLLML